MLPCELIADNGQRLRDLVTRMADAWGLCDGFHAWLASSVVFCDTLVDRIVPGRPAGEHRLSGGAVDEFPVQAERFLSWYLSGAVGLFDVLPLDRVHPGVLIVDSLAPYRALKVRLLNGSHTAMAVLGLEAGLGTVGQAVNDPDLGLTIRSLVADELAPSIDLPTDVVEAFTDAMWGRFGNPFIEHRLESILLNSSAKIPARYGDVVAWRAERGLASPGIADCLAAWLWRGRDRELPDSAPANAALRKLWAQAGPMREVAAMACSDATLLGVADWPASFMGDVAAALAARAASE